MTIEFLRETLLICTLMNFALLIVWGLMIMFLHDLIYRVHSRWFKISVERFDSIHYACIAIFKLSIFMFNLVPYLALGMAGG